MAKKNITPQSDVAAIQALHNIVNAAEQGRKEQEQNGKAKVYIPIDSLHDYPDHPYKVLDDESMDALTQSILERGIITPILIRPWEHAP